MRGDWELESFPSIQNISVWILTKKKEIAILLVIGFSYALLYLFFSKELLPALFEWRDFQFHYQVVRMVQYQSASTSFTGEEQILYPPLFHHCVARISSISPISIERGMLMVPLVAWTGSTFIIFLLTENFSQDDHAGIFSIIFLGVGASLIASGSGTIFFGRACIFPVNYLIAGFLPHVLGHFFGLLLIYLLITTHLRANTYIILGAGIGALLILTHFLAAITYALAVLCLCVSDRLTFHMLNPAKVGILVGVSVLITSPWWGEIVGDILEKPYLFMIGDAAKNWQGGILSEMMSHYGLIPIFSFVGAYYFIKSRNPGVFLILWTVMISILIFSRWGARFALELSVPLYMLGGAGFSQAVGKIRDSKNHIVFRTGLLILVIYVLCDSLHIFHLL